MSPTCHMFKCRYLNIYDTDIDLSSYNLFVIVYHFVWLIYKDVSKLMEKVNPIYFKKEIYFINNVFRFGNSPCLSFQNQRNPLYIKLDSFMLFSCFTSSHETSYIIYFYPPCFGIDNSSPCMYKI